MKRVAFTRQNPIRRIGKLGCAEVGEFLNDTPEKELVSKYGGE